MHPSTETPRVPEKLPTDVKLFHGFAAVLVLGVITALAFWKPDDSHTHRQPPSSPDKPRWMGAFSFTDQTGRTVTEAEVAGRFAVVNFIHTSCSISCLQVNQRMAEVQRLTAGQDDVRLLSFTVDPRTDTPPVLAKFGERFGTDATRWNMLTGDKAELYALIETSFLTRGPPSPDDLMPGGFADTDRIAVVDRDGQVRRYFYGMKAETPAVIVRYLDELRKERQ